MRSRILVVVAASLVLCAGACDWPMLSFGPARTGFSPDTSISKDAVASGSLVLDWTAKPGGTVGSAPVVVNGVVYAGNDDNKLYAFDAAGRTNCSGQPKTCVPLWTGATAGKVYSTPAVVNSVVYVGSGDNKLYAFDAAGGNGSCTGAVSNRTCTPLWTAATGQPVYESPAVVNGVVYVGSSDDKLYAFDAAGGNGSCTGTEPNRTCTPLWTAKTGAFTSSATSSPAVANGVVYIASTSQGGGLFAFDAAGGNGSCTGAPPNRTCTPLWVAPAAMTLGNPSVANGVVYVGLDHGGLVAVDAAGGNGSCTGAPPNRTCTPLWTAGTSGNRFVGPFGLAVANGVVYIGSEQGGLFAFDAAGGNASCMGTSPNRTCTPLWTAPAAGSVLSAPAVVNGVVYGGGPARFYAFDAAGGNGSCTGAPPNRTCTPLWTAATSGLIAPAVVDGVVYVGIYGGALYAFGLEKTPPTTSVVQPSNNTIVSGTTTLAASASDDVSVSKVEFHLTGRNYNDAFIGLATETRGFGWIYYWNTKSVPNGTYTLNSVATDPAGNVGGSATVTITVRN
jgi:outer membrane protein assembly factor BamB